jgi:hypothetical protein
MFANFLFKGAMLVGAVMAILFPLPASGQEVACCLPDGTCQLLLEEDCTNLGGFQPLGGVCLGDSDGNGVDDACEQGVVTGEIEFSVDIGSDTELSDPQQDGDEGFDPGDVYWWQGPPINPPEGRDGFKDDLFIFGQDPWPDPPDPGHTTIVPVGFGSPDDYEMFFDLDGHDQIDFSLTELIDPTVPVPEPGLPKEQFPSVCIHDLSFLAVSYDDDMAPGWPANDVAVTAPSPAGVSSYGMTFNSSEVIGVTLFQTGSGSFTWISNPFASEITVHQDMKPNPDNGDPEDDDVDSLDIVPPPIEPEQPACPFWLFTADHEATYGLDPGDIYEVSPAGPGPIKVIDEFIHLGIPEEADIDAFEMVWMELFMDPGGVYLAIVFSVDEDDPLTPQDESGGLNPNQLYLSYLTGYHVPLLVDPDSQQEMPLRDDVDALTNWMEEFVLPCIPPTIIACDSQKNHGTAGIFGIDMMSWTNTEPRFGGPDIVTVQFDQPIQAADGVLDITTLPNNTGEIVLNQGSGVVVASGPNTVAFRPSGLTDQTCFKVTVQNISAAGNPTCLMGPNPQTFMIALLTGDGLQNNTVNVLDVIQTQVRSGQAATPTSFRYDYDSNGVINVLDVIRVQSNSGNGASCP